jgi:hypothetical protein
MRVFFSRTGGFAPMPVRCKLDTDSMEPAQAQILLSLVDSTGILSLASAEVKGNDMHYYTVEVEKEGRSHRVRFDQISLPPKIKPLIDYLMANSKPVGA